MFIAAGTTINAGINVTVPLPAPSSVITSSSSVNEGSTITFTSTSTGVPDGTLYWTRYGGAANDADFSAVNGSFTVTDGVGTFTVTPVADHLTEGTELFSVVVRTGSITGPIIGTSAGKQILDTSLSPTYTLATAGNVTSVNEGAEITFNVTTTNVDDGTTLYWDVGVSGGNMIFARLSATSGSVTITGGAASFSITVSADNLTSPDQQYFALSLYKDAPNGYGVQVDSIRIDVNDTSQTPPVHGSAVINRAEGDYLSVAAGSHFNLGTTWTIEFWLYMNGPSVSIGGSGIQGLVNQGGWYYGLPNNSMLVGLAGGKLTVCQGENTSAIEWFEPKPQQWVHVAVVNNAGTQRAYYNGIEQVKTSENGGNGNYTNIELPVYIGALAPAYGSPLDGKITNLRITNTAVYTANFYPPTTLPTKIAGTKLLWNPTDQALTTDTSDIASVMTNNGATYSSSYPAVNSTRGSAVFDGSTNRYYRVPGGSHLQLGTTWTIEWWQKSTAATAGTGNLYAVMGQAPDSGRIDIYYQSGNLVVQNGQTLCAEPAVGVWVHVALVNNAGAGTVYYNGVAQGATGNFGNYGQTQDLYIGKRGNNAFQYFNGKLTNIRITDTAVYTSNFVPDQLPSVIASHTKLLLRPTVDTIYGIDEGNLGLAVSSSGATYSSDYAPVYQ
jgi:hypothetical protein